MKLMKNKEQDAAAKQQFKEDIDQMSEQMKFGMQTMDAKLMSQLELLEKKIQYKYDGFVKGLETRFTTVMTKLTTDSDQCTTFCQTSQQQIDNLNHKTEEIWAVLNQKLLPMESILHRIKGQLLSLNSAVKLCHINLFQVVLASEYLSLDTALTK